MEQYILDEFRVKNYLSFCDEQILDLSTGSSVTAFYGPNASGKSNLFHALTTFCHFIKRSTNPNLTNTPYNPFLLRAGNNQKPSIFTAIFHNDSHKYEYSFAIIEDRVLEEEMYDLSSSRRRTILKRSHGPSEAHTRNGFGKKLFVGLESVRDNSLLITLAQTTKNPYANAVFNLIHNLEALTLTDTHSLLEYATELLQKDPELEQEVSKYLRKADFSIKDFTYNVSRITPEMLSGAPFSDAVKDELIQSGKNVSVNTVHTVRNDEGDKIGNVTFNMARQESYGTRVFFSLITAVLNAIKTGKTLYIDEFGASLHTNICIFIINLFKKTDTKTNARLLINTHDIGLLKNGITGVLDKDDVIIVEKDRFEQTKITPLREKMTRSDENISKKYTIGIYGGIPIIEEMQ